MADAPITQFRAALKALLSDEFAVEQLAVHDDRLADSEGHDGAVAGVSPEAEVPSEKGLDSGFLIAVQVHGWFDAQIDEHQRVDPAKIEEWAYRLQKRIAEASSVDPDEAWWFDVIRTDYLDDPTGNKTRFRMLVQGHGANTAFPETGV